MKAFSQLLVSLAVVAAGLFVWIAYVPAARPLLERTGVLDLLGIEAPAGQAAASGGGRPRGGPASVIVASVGEMVREDRITAIGDGRARRSVTVRSNAVGVITGLNITTGGYVEQGTLIVKLQDEEETIALEQARIQLEDAKAEGTRIKRLQASGATTEVRLRETELLLRNAELAVRQAEFELSQRQIIAPISGWVGITDLEEGDRVNAQDELVTIRDRSDILIDFRVPERAVRNIKVGQSFEVMPLGFDDKTLIGEINAVDSVVDRASRTLRVQGGVTNEADLLRAGMAFSVNLSFPGETLLSIASLAVQWSSDGPFVWAVREGKVVQVTVEIIQRNSEEVLVASEGLSSGDLVVTEGVQTLRQGAEVNVSEQEVSAAAPAGGPKL
jgi:RND family efflux transporter MFP subunit